MIVKIGKYLAAVLLFMALQSSSGDGIPGTGNDRSSPVIRILEKETGSFDEIFSKANELYAGGNHQEAIIQYNRILAEGYHSAPLYYNLGNAYYRSGLIPQAILNYERAHLLAPGDEDIRFNLNLARMNVKDRIEELPVFFVNRWWKGARDLMSYRKWAAASAVTFVFSLVLLSLFLLASSTALKKTFFWFFIPVFLLSAVSFTFGLDQRNFIKNNNSAIVFSPVVSVKSSPDINSTDLFVIHEGTRVTVEDSIGDWRAVRLSDGNKGWLHKDGLEMI
jgi:tetratricopeptide (TPR) repeat protein